MTCPCKVIQDSLGFWTPWLWNLEQWIPIVSEIFRISWAEFWMPKHRMSVSTTNNFLNSRIWITLQLCSSAAVHFNNQVFLSWTPHRNSIVVQSEWMIELWSFFPLSSTISSVIELTLPLMWMQVLWLECWLVPSCLDLSQMPLVGGFVCWFVQFSW